MNVAYLGPLKDYSGYGEANRHIVAALDAAGVNVAAQMVTYTHDAADFGAIGETIDRLLANQADYRIKIIHTTPDQYHRFMEPGKYHIGHFFWETDLVPEEFAEGLALMDEIWTGSQANKEAITKAGVTVPVKIYPQPIDTDRAPVEKYEIPGMPSGTFLFYSIFEWHDRKNFEALLDSYWREFQDGERVGLLLKTYFTNFDLGNKRMIRSAIEGLKQRSGLTNFPPIYLYLELMDRSQIVRIHETGDCFVSATRGEGWGVPQVEAALQGNPIITTGYGGCAEYFKAGENAMILPYEMVPVRGMTHSRWYDRTQNWAEVDREALRASMRVMFGSPATAHMFGLAGQDLVKKAFNLKTVGKLMADRLKEIEGEL